MAAFLRLELRCFELRDKRGKSNEKIQFHDRSLISFSIAIEVDHRETLIFSDSSKSENENPTSQHFFPPDDRPVRKKKHGDSAVLV
jgi:hypothetical protein